ncbi:hypothetical protein CASFOL_011550 [Castilleja foliolosa]|uniref:Uncharacterized protein n=1 Tax=Castilleja foliolosa TaxID=1961234 RepID=A0ABD3DVU3_9LAMI
MEKQFTDEPWAHANSTENTVKLHEESVEEDETLSLSDLPLIHKKEANSDDNNRAHNDKENQTQDDFDFCSLSKQPEMCAADELFFQGQILPFRHSVSSEKGSLLQQYYKTRSVSRSESMDRLHSGSGGLISSRSSSISSHQSSSSGSSAGPNSRRPKLPPARNQFHSHPSPSPKIHFPSKNYRNYNSAKKSTVWSVFRLGVLTPPPEIAFMDLKQRSNCRNFGSRNSTDSNSSSISSGYKKKKKNRSLLGGCKCSADAVDTVPTRVVIINRSASESEMDALERESMMKMPMKKQAAKKQLSHRRTFEWLKQLSLEDAAD